MGFYWQVNVLENGHISNILNIKKIYINPSAFYKNVCL